MKTVFIVGSTGALGREAIEVVNSLGSNYRIAGIAGFKNYPLLLEQTSNNKVKLEKPLITRTFITSFIVLLGPATYASIFTKSRSSK